MTDRHRSTFPTRFAACLLVLLALSAAACSRGNSESPEAHITKGNSLFEQEQFAQAAAEYRLALRADPRNGEARYRLALASLQLGDGARALQEMVRAADLLPDRVDVQLDAGRVLVAASRFEDATTRVRRVLDREPRNVDALVLLGNASAGLKDPNEIIATVIQAARDMPTEPRIQAAVGAVQRRRGNIVGAETAFKNAVEADPKSVTARLALANFHWSMGQVGEVERVLREALAVDSPQLEVEQNLALFLTLAGRPAEAEPHLQRVVAARPDDPVPALALANVLAASGRTGDARALLERHAGPGLYGTMATARLAYYEHSAGEQARAYKRLDEAISASPKSAELHSMRGRLLLVDRRYDDVLSEARTVVDVAPAWFEGHYLTGSALVELGRIEEARKSFVEAERLEPRAAGPKAQLARMALAEGKADVAVQYASSAVAVAPALVLPRVLLARAQVARGDAKAAAEALKPVLDGAPDQAEVQVAAGAVAQLQRNAAAARAAYARALEMAPDSKEALAGLVAVDLAAGRVTDAAAAVNRRLEAEPKDADLLVLAARAQLAAKDPKKAEDLLVRAVNAAPEDMRAYQMLAALYFEQRRLEEAALKFQAVAVQQPGSAGPPTMLGVILQLQGKPADAQRVYEQLLGKNPDAAVAANNLAMLLAVSGGNLDVALNHAQTARRLRPDDPDIADTLGVVYTKKGLPAMAIPALEQSTTANPKNAEYWVHLGQAYAGAGRNGDARQAFERALALSPAPPLAAEARQGIDALR